MDAFQGESLTLPASLRTFRRRIDVGVPLAFLLGLPALLWAGDAAGVESGALILLGALVLLPLASIVPELLERNWLIDAMDRDLLVWVVLLGWCGVSLLWSPDPSYGFLKLRLLTLQGLLPGMAILLLARARPRISMPTVQWLGLLLLAVILAFAQGGRTRLVIGESNPIWIARGALLLVSIAIWSRQGKLSRPGVVVLGLYVALLTQSRGPVVAFIGANLLPIAAVSIRRAYRKFSGRSGDGFAIQKSSVVLLALSLLAIALWTVGLLSPLQIVTDAYGQKINRFANLSDPAALAGNDTGVLRLGWYASALEVFADHPVTGVGIGGYQSAASEAPAYPHNLPLEIGSELGLIGLGLWLFTLLLAARRAWGSSLLTALLAQAVGYTLFSGSIGNNYEYVVVAFLIMGYLPRPDANA